jgi:para-nitrobenzyl esterase
MGAYDRPLGEECLTLTIATPAADAGRRPVIVFLHGGAYLSGAGSLDWYDGGALARAGDCVVVGVNYRLGALGWLHLPGVAEGNAGLWDMVAALRFVQAEIVAFGGDPGQVTVVGQSAGAHAIMCLLTMPETLGLLHRAVLQSTPAALAPQTSALAAEYAGFMAELSGIGRDGLLTAPAAKLVEAQMQLARSVATFADATPPLLPVIDALADPTVFIAAAARAAAERGIALIIGTTREEMHAFFVPSPAMRAPAAKDVNARFAAIAGDAAAIELYRRRRPGGSVAALLGDLVTDDMFLFPSLALAQAVAGFGGEAFVYQFDWVAAGNAFGACHCIELPFVFGTLEAWPDAGMLRGGEAAEMAGIAAAIQRAWAEFARTGDPATPGLPWPAYTPGARGTMVFDRVIGVAGDPAGAAWRGGFEG